ncbi:MAG: hypothetical protein ACRD6W_01740, partial [Nitrososphaerales archaeon]
KPTPEPGHHPILRQCERSATQDQNYAGILMNADQTSVFFIAFAWYLLRILAEEEQEQRRKDADFLATYTEPTPPSALRGGNSDV